MFLHSKTISAFISRVRGDVREIVINEMKLKMGRERISYGSYNYPLNILVFEDNSRLGYFDSRSYELGLSKKLMYQAKNEVLKNIIRHELAHYICYLKFGPQIMHGEEFHSLCRSFGWGPEVYNAYANIELENEKIQGPENDEKTEKLLARLKKLLALASSNNIHESEMATLKANQLLLEHNLDLAKLNAQHSSDDEIIYVKRVLSAKRKNAKHNAICKILKTFFVSPITNSGLGIIYIEVIGDKTSVELADYVANFLDKEMEVLWNQAQKENPTLKGLTSKNSFFRGIGNGYVLKIEKQKNSMAKSSELFAIEKNLKNNLEIVYPRLSYSHSSAGHDERAHQLGSEKGSNLSIKPGLAHKSSETFFLT